MRPIHCDIAEHGRGTSVGFGIGIGKGNQDKDAEVPRVSAIPQQGDEGSVWNSLRVVTYVTMLSCC